MVYGNGTVSVCPSVPSIDRCISVRRVCCCGPGGRAITIDCCTARLRRERPPRDPYPQQHGAQQQTPAVSRIQRRRKLDKDLLLLQSLAGYSSDPRLLVSQPVYCFVSMITKQSHRRISIKFVAVGRLLTGEKLMVDFLKVRRR